MNPDPQDEDRKDPGEAEGDGKARHGYRNEVSWDGGRGAQPYANRGEQEQGPGAAHGTEGGDRGDVSGRNLDQLQQVSGKPQQPPEREASREDVTGRGGVS